MVSNKVINLVIGASIIGVLVIALLSSNSESSVTVTPVAATPTLDTILSTPVSGNKCPLNVVKNEAPAPVKVQRLSPDKARVVELNGEVTPVTVNTAINALRKLDTSTAPVYLLINSPGGSVIDGAMLVSQMESMKAPVYTVCTQLCASMAAIIHQYGVKRFMVNRSILMFHPASGGAQGQIKNMKSRIVFIDKYVDKFNTHIIARSKMTKAEYDIIVAYEQWLDSDDSMEKGVADGVVALDTEVSTAPVPSDKQRGTTTSIDDIRSVK